MFWSLQIPIIDLELEKYLIAWASHLNMILMFPIKHIIGMKIRNLS